LPSSLEVLEDVQMVLQDGTTVMELSRWDRWRGLEGDGGDNRIFM